MRRVIGFALFFIAIGMIVAMIIPNKFAEILIVMICLLIGYHLFCC